MPRRKSRTLTEVELEFMHVIWASGETTSEKVRMALREQGRDLADGSVRKILSILLAKGYLSRYKDGREFVYSAAVPEEQAKASMLADLLKRAYGGSAALLVASLFDSRQIRKKDLQQIRRLIAEREGRK